MSLRSCKDLLLETKKLIMSHWFAERHVEMPTSSIEFVVHSALFHPYYLLLSHLHYRFWKQIVTLSRVIGIIMREFYSIKLVLKFLVIISRCSINKGDIIKVRLYLEGPKIGLKWRYSFYQLYVYVYFAMNTMVIYVVQSKPLSFRTAIESFCYLGHHCTKVVLLILQNIVTMGHGAVFLFVSHA